MSLTLAAARAAVARPGGMTADETRSLFALLMGGNLPVGEGAQLLESWSARGETAAELVAVVQELLGRALRPSTTVRCLDVVGTGGSGLDRYNVSTTAAFVAAAAGVPVAKHGNKGSQRPNGSFDLLEALGVPYQLPVAALERLLARTGICFLFARSMHPAMAAVAPMRRLCPRRTIFNLAGPLANPWRPVRQLTGCARTHYGAVMAATLSGLGMERAAVVVGHPGIDEISVTGPTELWEVDRSGIRHRIEAGCVRPDCDYAALPGGDGVANAVVFRRLLTGDETGPLRDMVAVNAGVVLDLWRDRALGSAEGLAEARELIATGAAWRLFERHREAALAEASQAG